MFGLNGERVVWVVLTVMGLLQVFVPSMYAPPGRRGSRFIGAGLALGGCTYLVFSDAKLDISRMDALEYTLFSVALIIELYGGFVVLRDLIAAKRAKALKRVKTMP